MPLIGCRETRHQPHRPLIGSEMPVDIVPEVPLTGLSFDDRHGAHPSATSPGPTATHRPKTEAEVPLAGLSLEQAQQILPGDEGRVRRPFEEGTDVVDKSLHVHHEQPSPRDGLLSRMPSSA